jgi:hypothetical protein
MAVCTWADARTAVSKTRFGGFSFAPLLIAAFARCVWAGAIFHLKTRRKHSLAATSFSLGISNPQTAVQRRGFLQGFKS